MQTQQPEALHLAHLLALDKWPDAATELRRLHSENQDLRTRHYCNTAEIESLRARVQELGEMARENRSKKVIELERCIAELESEAEQNAKIIGASAETELALRARVEELERELAAIGAGGVEPLRKAAAAQAAVPETREALGKRLIADVKVANAIAAVACQRVAELPDRDSPADWPEAMLVTCDELHMIVREAAIEAQAAPAHPAEGATAQAVKLLAADHSGMKVDYRGLFYQVQRALKRTDPGHAEMLRQLEGHLQELGQRWYAGDTAVVDELLQLYSVECQARDALAAQAEQEQST